MVNKQKPILLLSVLFLLTLFLLRIYGQQDQVETPISDHDLSTYSAAELELRAAKKIYTPDEVPYYEALLKKGINESSSVIIYKALFGLLNHYYYALDIENLNHWVHFTDSLAANENSDPDVYYDAHRNRASLLLELKEYEQAINETIALYKKAEKSKHYYGMACSSELLGHIYLSSQQDSAAVEAFQNAYNRLKETGKYFEKQALLVSSMLESYLRLNNLDTIPTLLKEFEGLLTLKEKEQQQRGIELKTNWYQWQLHSFYADLYLRKGEIDKVRVALNKSSSYYEEGMTAGSDFSVFYYLYVKASYFKKMKKYPEALSTIDFILTDFPEPPCIKLKIDILTEMGKFKEVLSLYQELLHVTRKRNNEAFVHKVNNLQALYDKNDQEIRQRELQLVNIQVEAKRRLIIYIMSASIIFLVLILILARFLRHTFKLKNELEKDKSSLIVSQERLKQEKSNADMADQMKDTFIANISHEIRTPLNTIVGFSALLSEMSFEEEEKKCFIKLIEKNSSLLLDLVNDVLDLSRLESGRTKITITPCELTQCCQILLDGTTKQLAPNVKLTFSPSVSPFTLQTDSHLLSQLLNNLLSNAAKFTPEGEINLAYETNDAARQVVFSITDTGSGIPTDKQNIIFDHFEKLNEYTQGSGLGLPICRTIAQKLGGSIMIDSAYILGTRFIFVHPYDVPDTSIHQKQE